MSCATQVSDVQDKNSFTGLSPSLATLSRVFFFPFLITYSDPTTSGLRRIWAPPFSLAATRGISFDFFSCAYLDVSVGRVPSVNLFIGLTVSDITSDGLLHSEICGSKLLSSSSQLIATLYVLLRYFRPRHPPYALMLSIFWLLNEFRVLNSELRIKK